MIYTDGIHLISDISDIELHKFAKNIGLKRTWFQDKKRPHYDLTTKNKVRLAINSGAKIISKKELCRLLIKE